MISRKTPLREVYVWELPVRVFHWVNAFCIVALCATGYVIGNPPAIQHATPPSENYWFGYVRFVHFAVAFLFIANFLGRIYWAFAGNKFARWRNYLPLTRRQWRGIGDTLKVDIFLLTPKPVYDIGHNSLAAVTYFGVFLLFIVQSVTGLCMFYASSDSVLAPYFERFLIWTGGFFLFRDIHHIVMWLFILFTMVHVYLVFYHDYIERNGVASSIIGGWKFIKEDIVLQEEALQVLDEQEATGRKVDKPSNERMKDEKYFDTRDRKSCPER